MWSSYLSRLLNRVLELRLPVNDQFTRAMEHIRDRWIEGQSLREIASIYRLDAGNLERCFRNRFGMTVKSFVDEKRKEYVLSQLKKDGRLGYEIGSELGFRDDLAFYRWVKRAFGLSLKDLREANASERKNGVSLDSH